MHATNNTAEYHLCHQTKADQNIWSALDEKAPAAGGNIRPTAGFFPLSAGGKKDKQAFVYMHADMRTQISFFLTIDGGFFLPSPL